MTSDLTICVLSCIEPPLPECLAAVKAQEGGPYRVIQVRDCFPMSQAFNEMVRRSQPSRFVLQVDGDVVLKPWAVRVLYSSIQRTPLVYMAWGQLYEDGFGLGGSVRIWRRWPLRLFRFRDRRCVDRNLHARIRWTGMRRLPVDVGEPFGVHYPRQTRFARFSKAYNDTQKWITLGRWDQILLNLQAVWNSEEYEGTIAALGREEGRWNSKDAHRDWQDFDGVRRLAREISI